MIKPIIVYCILIIIMHPRYNFDTSNLLYSIGFSDFFIEPDFTSIEKSAHINSKYFLSEADSNRFIKIESPHDFFNNFICCYY